MESQHHEGPAGGAPRGTGRRAGGPAGTVNLTWTPALVGPAERAARDGHRGAVVWLTGLSASGKSTVARLLERELHGRGVRSYVLDGDNIRHGLNSDLGFGPTDRTENIRRIGEVARLMMDAGLVAIVAFISPYLADRARCRRMVPPGSFVEVFCRCPLEVCERRDPKGLYRKARRGELPEFTGIDAPYEEPVSPELALDTGRDTPSDCVERVLSHLCRSGVLSPGAAPLQPLPDAEFLLSPGLPGR